MVWDIPNIWKGEEVWILGGGPSLISNFNIPEDVVQSVRAKQQPLSVYSPYMEKIHGKHIIGINVAYQFGNWVDFCFYGDRNFALQHSNAIRKYNGVPVCSHPIVSNQKNVKHTPLDHSKLFGISTKKKRLSWNKNSGACAINLAYYLGAKRIILVGFDMQLEGMQQHWHNVYKGAWTEEKLKKKETPFKKHLEGFPAIARDANRLGLEIINVSLNSAITEFPKVDINTLV